MVKQDSNSRTGRSKRPPRTWGGVLKKRQIKGAIQREYRNWIRNLYHTQGPGAPFTLREMMTACGKNCDDRKEYTQSNLFMMKMRKDFAVVMEMFFAPSGAYEGHKAAGKTDSAIFEELVNAALTYDVYPVWADPYDSHKYKLFEMASFAFLVERRAAAMAKEIETKAPVMALIFSKIPELQSFYTPPKLKGDGVLLELPPGVDCTICHQVFHDQAGFVTHYNEHHLQATEKKEHVVVSPEQVEKVCPLCKIPLRQLEKGDWKCPGCKQVVNGEQINQPQEEE